MANSNEIRARAAGRLRRAGELGKQATQDWIDGVTQPISDYLGMTADVLEGRAKLGDLVGTTLAFWIETAHLTCSSYHALCRVCTGEGDDPSTSVAFRPAQEPTFTIDDHAEAADAVPLEGIDLGQFPDLVASHLLHEDGMSEVPASCVSLTTYDDQCCVSLRDLRGFPRRAGLYEGFIRSRSTGEDLAPISLQINLHHPAV